MNEQTAWSNRQRWHKLTLTILVILCSSVVTMVADGTILAFYPKLQDKNSRLDLTISSDAVAGMGNPNDPVKFTVKLVNNGDKSVNGMLGWSINSTAIPLAKIPDQAIRVDAGKTKEFTKTIMLPQAGFVEMVCKFQQSETVKSIQKKSRVGCNSNQLRTPLTKQNDFDEFWERSIAELKSVPPAFKTIERSKMSDGDIRVFEVSMRSHNQVRVRGWLEVPSKASKPLPVVIRVPGYGQSMKPIGKCDDMVVFSFNPRGHGNSQQDISGQPNNFWIRGLDNAETYYYRGSYLDCIRAVDFIAARPDVDQDKIAIWGGSQGGGFAFATAALDSRVDYCIADIPFLCDWINYFRLSHWPEMDNWIAEQPQRSWESTLRTLSYFDTMNLAERIRCPTLMSVGLQDGVCPPTTCFNTFNRIPGEKNYRIYPNKRHGLGKEHYAWIWTQLREAFISTD
jgi:cephalosporin-C deacetylase